MALEYGKLKKECPKALAKLEGFITLSLQDFQKRILEEYEQDRALGNISDKEEYEIPEITEDIVKQSIESLFSTGSIKTLYDFFDGYKVYITPTTSHEGGWHYSIYSDGATVSSGSAYKSRIECEIVAFESGFQELEKIL